MGTDGPAAINGRSRLDQVLDLVGLLLLGWMVALWRLGAPDVPIWPRFSEFSGDHSVRSELTLVLAILTLRLVVAVLTGFGRPPGRARSLAAVPLLVFLAAVAVWRFTNGFVPAFGDSRTESIVGGAGLWDGAVTQLGFAAAALLVIRAYRLTRRLVLIATAAVVTAVTASVIAGVLAFAHLFQVNAESNDVSFRVAVFLPPLLIALLGVGMAPVWLRELWQGDLRAAAALVLWGFVVGAGAVLPTYFGALMHDWRLTRLSGVELPVDGLDWAAGGLAVAAAVLIAPVVRAYSTFGSRVRASVLVGPFGVLALLLIFRLGGQLIEYGLLAGRPEFTRMRVALSNEQPAVSVVEPVIAALALIGAALMLLAAGRLSKRSSRLVMSGAVLMIVVPVGLYLVPGLFQHDPYELASSAPGTIVVPLALWPGDSYMLIFGLPVLLLALLIGNRARSIDSGSAEGPTSVARES